MVSVDELKELLDELYGIKSERDLDIEIEKLGGIDIAIFTQAPKGKTYQLAG